MKQRFALGRGGIRLDRYLVILVLGIATLLHPTGAWAAFGFGSPAALHTNAATDSGNDTFPHVVTDGAGNWLAVWQSTDTLGATIGTDNDILVSRSADNGFTWTVPVALNSNATTDAGADITPWASTNGSGTWIVVWNSTENLGGTIGTDSDVLLSISTNNGASWSAPAVLNSNATTDTGSDLVPRLSTDGGGNWVATWQSSDSLGGTIGSDVDILFSRSTDNGANWSNAAALNTNAATDSFDDRGAFVEVDGFGNWVAVWSSDDSLGGTIGLDDDILVARSTDGGATWTAPVALNTNAATDSGDDNSPRVATDSDGNWVAVWQSFDTLGGTIGIDSDILVSRSADNGASWSAPAALNSSAATGSGDDVTPHIATDSTGNWVTVWDSSETLSGTIGLDFDILVARSTDNGATWTDPEALNSNAATDSGSDRHAEVATDGAGHWIVAWDSTDSLGATVGTDNDIFVSTSSDITLPVELDMFGVE